MILVGGFSIVFWMAGHFGRLRDGTAEGPLKGAPPAPARPRRQNCLSGDFAFFCG